MPKCTDARIDFGRFARRVIEADFGGRYLSSDGGLLLLRQVDEQLGRAARRPRRSPIRATRSASRTRCVICWRSACTGCAAATRI
jgi:hypothetical protein